MDTEPRILPPDGIADLVGGLCRSARVMAPVRRGPRRDFVWIDEPAEVVLGGDVPRVSFKEALLPRSEVLLYYRLGKGTESAETPPAPDPQVLFGLPSCDLHAVAVLDAVFGAEPMPDKPYLDRRAVTFLVGCGADPDAVPGTCFCEEVGISAMDPAGADWFLAPLGDGRYVVEFVSDRGRRRADLLADLSPAGGADLAAVAALRERAASRVRRDFDPDRLAEKLDGLFESDLWQRLADRCVGCGACAFLCPTCHCFDISDEQRGGTGARVRSWDTCQFSLFTRHASGHNPRPEQAPRARQRIMHKFNYGYRNFGIAFCVGCGRCIEACPAGGDIREALDEIDCEEGP